MALNVQNFTTLVGNMAAAVQNSATALLDLTVGSTLRAILEGSAAAGLWLQSLILTVSLSTRLATSVGAQCDTWGADFGFYRLPGVASSGYVTFGRYTATSSVFIANGSQVRSADGTQTFTVVADPTNVLYNGSTGYTIPALTATANILVVNTTVGTAGNVLASTISQIIGATPGIDYCNNATGFTNGANAESDAAMRTRFQNFVATRAAGTTAAILYAATSAALNLTATVVFGAPGTGFFTVYVDDGTGAPPAATLALVGAAVTAVRAGGINSVVSGPTLISASVAATLTTNAATNHALATAAAAQAVTAFINALPMGAVCPYSRLAQVIYDSYPGITNISGLLLNGATADLGGAATQVVRSTSVIVS
jgi:uncharacterized phage protein gp47/JayE